MMVNGNDSNLRIGPANQTPMTTTAMGQRDQLGLNRPNSEMRSVVVAGDMAGDDISVSATSFATSIGGGQSMSIREMAKAERRALKRARKELEMALANLPAPQFEYELEAPEMVTDEDDHDDKKMQVEKDAADIEAENLAQLEREAAKLYEKRSSVVKRKDLPRPVGAITDKMVLETVEAPNQDDAETLAQNLIREEMLVILQHDAFKFPVTRKEVQADKKKNDKKNKMKTLSEVNIPIPPEKPLQMISDESFKSAKEMLDNEVERLVQEKRSLALDMYRDIQSEEEMKALLVQETMKSRLSEDKHDSQEYLKVEYKCLIDKIRNLQKKNDKLESKLSIMNGGYMKRCNALYETAQNDFAEIQNSRIEESVYRTLMLMEKRGISSRVEKLQNEIDELENIEAGLQKRYGDLLHEKTRRKILNRQKEQTVTLA
jgi:pre-mRNA-splicing factor CDC5/CEF1